MTPAGGEAERHRRVRDQETAAAAAAFRGMPVSSPVPLEADTCPHTCATATAPAAAEEVEEEEGRQSRRRATQIAYPAVALLVTWVIVSARLAFVSTL